MCYTTCHKWSYQSIIITDVQSRIKWRMWRKNKMGIMQEYYVLFWKIPGSNTQQNSSCTATYFPSHNIKEKILEATLCKTVAVQPCTSHLTTHPNMTKKTYWWSQEKLINDVLQGTSTHECAWVGQTVKT